MVEHEKSGHLHSVYHYSTFKTSKVKDEHKKKNSKLMSFQIDGVKLLEKYKIIWTKIEDLKSIELNVLPVYDDRCIKPNNNIWW